jgi:hypothetical protein
MRDRGARLEADWQRRFDAYLNVSAAGGGIYPTRAARCETAVTQADGFIAKVNDKADVASRKAIRTREGP